MPSLSTIIHRSIRLLDQFESESEASKSCYQLFYLIMSLSSHQQKHQAKPSLESGQSRLALISYLTQKKESSSFFKKKTFIWDQQRLYNQNLTLRSQIKDLTDANIKAKTRILQLQALMKTSQIRASEKETPFRSLSLKSLNKRPLGLFRPKAQDEEARVKNMRQIVRELREQISTLKNQNSALKRSLKFTRMNELQAMNTEMEIELQRLHALVGETKEKYYIMSFQFENLKSSIKKQSDAKKIALHEKNKLQNQLFKLQRQKANLQKKSDLQDKKLRQQMKKTRIMNPQLAAIPSRQTPIQLNSVPKLQYSISGFDADTINFDRLIGTESQLKSVPKLASLTSLQLFNKQSLGKYEMSPQPVRKVRLNEMNTPPVPQNKHDYELQEREITSQEHIKNENTFLPLQTKKALEFQPKKSPEKQVKQQANFLPQEQDKVRQVSHQQVKEESDYENLFQVAEQEISNADETKKEVKAPQKLELSQKPAIAEQQEKNIENNESEYEEVFEGIEEIEEIEDI